MQKDILFYSQFCNFSKEVLDAITKHNLKESFMLVCVDNKQLKLPVFVDRVPLIYTTGKKLLSDEHVLAYLKSKVEYVSLEPYALVGGNTNAYSDNYSFLQSDESLTEDSSRNYNVIGREQRIYAPEENDVPAGKVEASVLDKVMAERANDLQKLFPSNNGFTRVS
jgi:hypothetical protein